MKYIVNNIRFIIKSRFNPENTAPPKPGAPPSGAVPHGCFSRTVAECTFGSASVRPRQIQLCAEV